MSRKLHRALRLLRRELGALEPDGERLRAEVAQRLITEHELRCQVASLEIARDRAEAADRAKRAFLDNMSHEVRTPLNAVLGFAQLLLDMELTPKQRECAVSIGDSGSQLLDVLGGMLDLSKLEAGGSDLEAVPFEIEDLVVDTARTFATRTKRKHVEMVVEIDSDVPRSVSGDPHCLRQVLTQLVANATTFTSRGSVSVRVEQASASPLELRFSVADTGVGLDVEDADRLFMPFEQADNSSTRRYGGAGLGLAICQRLVELMHGRLAVSSVKGEGSTFWFTARFDGVALPSWQPSTSIADRRVLVIDECEDTRRILAGMLRRHGAVAVAVPSLQQALEAVDRGQVQGGRFCIALANIDALQGAAIERLRSQPGGRTLTILPMSPTPKTATQGFAPDGRSLDALAKPVKERELIEGIARALRPGSLPEAEAPHPKTDSEGGSLRLLLVEDSISNQRLFLAMLEAQGHSITVANDGEEALTLYAADAFDVVFMDVQMPRMDGFACTARIRGLEEQTGGHVPIVAMTAHAVTGDRERCLAGGMDAYLAKPIRRELLLETLTALRRVAKAALPRVEAAH